MDIFLLILIDFFSFVFDRHIDILLRVTLLALG